MSGPARCLRVAPWMREARAGARRRAVHAFITREVLP